jgi:hypothetical protein
MGRRSRRRAPAADSPSTRWQTARVRVDDATWHDFRQAIRQRSVTEVLGAFVQTEVARWHRRRSDGPPEALERAEALSATLRALVGRLEARLGQRRYDGPGAAPLP